MADLDAILKYLKVKALADRGDPGERDNAKRILKKLATENPGIEKAAAQYVKQQAQAEKEATQPEEPVREKPFPFGGNWEELFNFARTAVNGAYDFANTVANAYAGRQLAEEEVEVVTRSSRSGNVLITFKMTLLAYNQAQRLNLAQKTAFRQVLHEQLAAELDEMLGLEEE